MGRKGGRDQGLGNAKFINLGSHLPQIYNEGKGGGEEREHWTKIGQGSQAGGRGLIGLFSFGPTSHHPCCLVPFWSCKVTLPAWPGKQLVQGP